MKLRTISIFSIFTLFLVHIWSADTQTEIRTQTDPLTEQFMDLRRALAQSHRQMVAESTGLDQVARTEQLHNWRMANAAQLEQMRELARQAGERNAAERPEQDLPTLEQYKSRIPKDASPALRELMEEQFAMRQARQLAGVEERSMSEAERTTRMQGLQQANQTRMSRIRQLSEAVLAASQSTVPQRPLPTLEQFLSRLPEDATPVMRELMEERYHLQADHRALTAGDAALTSEERQARHAQFLEQQAVRLERVHRMAAEVANEGRVQ